MFESFQQPNNTTESLRIRDKLKSWLRPAFLAAAVGAGSLVSLGCDKANTPSAEKPSQGIAHIEHEQDAHEVHKPHHVGVLKEHAMENPTVSPHEYHPSPQLEAKRQQFREERAYASTELHASEKRVLEVAMQKGLISPKQAQGHHNFSILEVGKVPIEATVDGNHITFSQEDYTHQELETLRSVGYMLTDRHTLSILQQLGVLDQTPIAPHSSSESKMRTAPQDSPQPGVQQGNRYDRPQDF